MLCFCSFCSASIVSSYEVRIFFSASSFPCAIIARTKNIELCISPLVGESLLFVKFEHASTARDFVLFTGFKCTAFLTIFMAFGKPTIDATFAVASRVQAFIAFLSSAAKSPTSRFKTATLDLLAINCACFMFISELLVKSSEQR